MLKVFKSSFINCSQDSYSQLSLTISFLTFRNAALKECDSEVKRLTRELDKIEEVASDLEAVENDDNLFAGENKNKLKPKLKNTRLITSF